MSVLPIKYPTEFPIGCQFMACRLNVLFLNIRLTPYLLLYIQKYLRLLYNYIGGWGYHIQINALTRLTQYHDYIRSLLKSFSSLDINNKY
jgi:hypothetical protein